MPYMTLQKVFSTVRRHLLTQKCQAIDEINHRCVYRTARGLKCAIGCLIPKELYRGDMEGSGFDYLPTLTALRFVGAMPKTPLETARILCVRSTSHGQLLLDLQKIHDDCAPIEWEIALKATAERWGFQLEGDTP